MSTHVSVLAYGHVSRIKWLQVVVLVHRTQFTKGTSEHGNHVSLLTYADYTVLTVFHDMCSWQHASQDGFLLCHGNSSSHDPGAEQKVCFALSYSFQTQGSAACLDCV